MKSIIKKLTKRLAEIDEQLIAELEKEYPISSVVDFYFMHGQVNPSRGEVISHPGGQFAHVRVRMFTFKGMVKNVSAEDIVSY